MKKNTSKSLAFYLSFSILFFVSLVFIGLLLYNYSVSRSLLLKNVEENTRNLTSSAINKSEGFFYAIEKIAYNTAIFIRNNPHSQSNTEELLCEIVEGNREIYGSCMAWKPVYEETTIHYYAPYCWKENDSVFTTDLADDEYFYPDWEWYKIPAQTYQPIWSEPYFDEGGGNALMTTFSVPVFERDSDTSSFAGILTVDVSLQWLHEMVSAIKIFQTGFAFLISKSGIILSHPDTSLIMKTNIFSFADSEDDGAMKNLAKKIIEEKQGFEIVEKGFFKEKSWIYFSSLENNSWTLAFVFPERELYSDLHVLNIKLFFIFILGIILLFVFIIWLSSKLTLPMRKLTNLIDDEGENFINKKIPEIKGSREVTVLNQSFISLQTKLQQHIKEIEVITSEKQRIDSEILMASSLQMSMLPHINDEKLNHEIDIKAFIRPARNIGGDFYEVNFIDEKHVFFAIGDVSGKGMGAAMFMAMTITLLRAYSKLCGNDVKQIIQLTDNYLLKNNKKKYFVTLFAGILNVETGIFEWVNAGHNFPYIHEASSRKIKILKITHLPPLGILSSGNFSTEKTRLNKNDILFMYTDGLTEAMNATGELFSTQRLYEIVNEKCSLQPVMLLNHILMQIDEFASNTEQNDDITMLVFKRAAPETRKMCFQLECKTESIEAMRNNIETSFSDISGNQKTINKLILVLEEIITNIIKYGQTVKQTPKIDVLISMEIGWVSVQVIDNTAAFNPVEKIKQIQMLPPSIETIGKRGLLVVSRMTEQMSYFRDNETNNLMFKIQNK